MRMRIQVAVLSTEMALRGGALRLSLLFSSRNYYKFTSCGGVRSLSENVSSKPVTSSDQETTRDHLIYTQEHFALKESLRKVCRSASIVTSFDVTVITRFILYLPGDSWIF